MLKLDVASRCCPICGNNDGARLFAVWVISCSAWSFGTMSQVAGLSPLP